MRFSKRSMDAGLAWNGPQDGTLAEVVARFEAGVIACALEWARGNRQVTAQALGIGYSTLKAKMKTLPGPWLKEREQRSAQLARLRSELETNRQPTLNDLDASLAEIVAKSLGAAAGQITQAVRESLAAEIRGDGALPAPKRHGRKGARANRRRATQADLDAVLYVVAKMPGVAISQLQAATGLDKRSAAKVLLALRASGKIEMTGDRTKARYSAV